jgi:hypothetical protein
MDFELQEQIALYSEILPNNDCGDNNGGYIYVL